MPYSALSNNTTTSRTGGSYNTTTFQTRSTSNNTSTAHQWRGDIQSSLLRRGYLAPTPQSHISQILMAFDWPVKDGYRCIDGARFSQYVQDSIPPMAFQQLNVLPADANFPQGNAQVEAHIPTEGHQNVQFNPSYSLYAETSIPQATQSFYQKNLEGTGQANLNSFVSPNGTWENYTPPFSLPPSSDSSDHPAVMGVDRKNNRRVPRLHEYKGATKFREDIIKENELIDEWEAQGLMWREKDGSIILLLTKKQYKKALIEKGVVKKPRPATLRAYLRKLRQKWVFLKR